MTFGEAVQQVLTEHGLTLRSQRHRTGLAHSTIKNWIDGVQPNMEAVIQWARGFGLDVNEWLELAGYERIDSAPAEEDYHSRMGRLVREMMEELAAEGVPPHLAPAGFSGSEGKTPEDADRDAEVLRQMLREIYGGKGQAGQAGGEGKKGGATPLPPGRPGGAGGKLLCAGRVP